ncbi:hypothetical protein Tco_1409571 [Tanacetum coccineum]
MSRAPRWRVRRANPKEEQKEGWVLVGQGHPASNRRGLSSGSSLLAEKNGSEGGWILYFRVRSEVKAIREDCPPGKEEGKKALSSISTSFPRGLYSTHSPVSRTAQVSVRLRMRTSFPSAHSPFTRFSKQRRKGGQQVPRALCPTHLSRSKCSSPVPPNAPICRQISCECVVMLRMLRHRIDRPSSRSFLVHSLYISDTQGRTRWEGRSPSLCLADHSAGISHSRPCGDDHPGGIASGIGVDSASVASCRTGVIQYVVLHVPPLLRSFLILIVKHHEQQDVEVQNLKGFSYPSPRRSPDRKTLSPSRHWTRFLSFLKSTRTAALSTFHNVRAVAHEFKFEWPFEVPHALFDRQRGGKLPSMLAPAAVPLEPPPVLEPAGSE